MTEIRASYGNDAFDRLVASHRISGGDTAPIWRDDFETFLEERQAALWARIKAVTGVTKASDLIEEELET